MNKLLLILASLLFGITGCAVNHLDEGLSASREGDYSAMLKHCSKATKQPNADPRAFKCLAEAQLNLGHRQQAEESLLTYLSKVPNDLEARFTIINLYFNSGRYSAAQAHLDSILNQDPVNLEALYLLGELQRLSGNCDAALIAYDKVLTINSGFQAAIISKAKAEADVCGITEQKEQDPELEDVSEPELQEQPKPKLMPKPKNIKSKKFKAGGAMLNESDW